MCSTCPEHPKGGREEWHQLSSHLICGGALALCRYDGDGRPTNGDVDHYNVLDSGKLSRDRRGVGGIVTTRAAGQGGA